MVQNGRISDFHWLLTLSLTLDPGMVITFFFISHRVLPVYQISSKSKKLFVDGRTHGRTDGNLPPIVLGRLPKFGSRPNEPNTANNCKLDWSVQRHTTGAGTWLQASDESIIGCAAAKWELRLHSAGEVWYLRLPRRRTDSHHAVYATNGDISASQPSRVSGTKSSKFCW